MHLPGSLEEVRTEALHKVGRNVVNYAKIEAALKLLLASTNISGSPRELLRKQQQGIKANHKRTLGELVLLLSKSIRGEVEKPVSIPEALEEVHISVSFKIEDDTNSSERLKKSLQELVKERNDLIHHRLAELDVTSLRSHKALIDYLDEQNTKILAKMKMIRCVFDVLRMTQDELAGILESYITKPAANDESLEAQQ